MLVLAVEFTAFCTHKTTQPRCKCCRSFIRDSDSHPKLLKSWSNLPLICLLTSPPSRWRPYLSWPLPHDCAVMTIFQYLCISILYSFQFYKWAHIYLHVNIIIISFLICSTVRFLSTLEVHVLMTRCCEAVCQLACWKRDD